MKKYNLLLVEDDPFTKQTLSYELKRREEINFLGAFDNGKDAVEYVKTNTPDIMPGESPQTEEPGGLWSLGSQRVGHNWVTKRSTAQQLYQGI